MSYNKNVISTFFILYYKIKREWLVVAYLPADSRREVLHNEPVVRPHRGAIPVQSTQTKKKLLIQHFR